MRAAFGLVSVLVALGIIAMLMRTYTLPMAERGISAREEAAQISGRDAHGMRASDSISLAPRRSAGGDLQSFIVSGLIVGGPMESFFGLQRGDEIIEVGQFRIRDIPGGEEMAEALVIEAYQRRQPLVVLRNNEELVLPHPDDATAPQRLGVPQQQTPDASALERQFDAMRPVESH